MNIRIRPVSYITKFFGSDKGVRTEWVVEQQRERLEEEDDYQYERDAWVRITSGSTEIEAKKALVAWLNAEIESAGISADEYAD